MDIELLRQQCDFATSVKITEELDEDRRIVVVKKEEDDDYEYDFILVPRSLMREILSKVPNDG